MFFDLLSTRLSTLEAQKRFRGKQPQAELKKGCAYKEKNVYPIGFPLLTKEVKKKKIEKGIDFNTSREGWRLLVKRY